MMANTVIVGPGAIGLTIASALGADGRTTVHMVARGVARDRLAKEGLVRRGVLGTVWVRPERMVLLTLAEAAALEPTCLILAVRATDLPGLAAQLQQTGVSPATSVVVVANGFDVTSTLGSALGGSPILRAVVTTGAHRRHNHPNAVDVLVHGLPVAIGPSCEAANELARTLTDGGLPAVAHAQIGELAKAKALLNCCLNAPAAVSRSTIAEVVGRRAGRTLVEEVLHEAWRATVGLGGLLRWPTCQSYFDHLMDTVVPQIGSHHPSMWRDLSEGRVTEIEYLNGFVVREAERQGWRAALNRTVVQAVLSGATLTLGDVAA